ncbi:DUF4136 domain-containing protein [Hymenobacter lapidiphilus]|uniref:DUF4136 domain-containing protein n=1 Tax=Hymenobacter lapidiphilus TaxID=2608003 RepID=A0A7Y7U7C7_9BACT|nr:DUF4136 domain-containing protein [Hymenobacter lapidiphilus]NVO32385.1 DUF4136 domain-containing protein [Hymenobacter lapidiphilus]
MKNTLLPLLFVLMTLLAGCTPGVAVQKKPGTDFSQYRTYDWAKTEVKSADSQNPIYQSSLNDGQIQQAISSELAKRGIRQATGNAKPDFYLTYHLYIDEAERTVATPQPMGFAYPYAVSYRGGYLPINYGYWYASPRYRTRYRTETYQEGTMILDFVDARTNNLVWRGSVMDAVNDPARLGSEFSRAAKDILDEFPVQKM